MNIYSDTLSYRDLTEALPEGVYIDRCITIPKPRKRTNGWNIRLGRIGSKRRFNSGTHGGGEDGAASWDDWGYYLANLFKHDNCMTAGPYHNEMDFNGKTRYKYAS